MLGLSWFQEPKLHFWLFQGHTIMVPGYVRSRYSPGNNPDELQSANPQVYHRIPIVIASMLFGKAYDCRWLPKSFRAGGSRPSRSGTHTHRWSMIIIQKCEWKKSQVGQKPPKLIRSNVRVYSLVSPKLISSVFVDRGDLFGSDLIPKAHGAHDVDLRTT